jgi:magnesium-transporting ATPase (P-type)
VPTIEQSVLDRRWVWVAYVVAFVVPLVLALNLDPQTEDVGSSCARLTEEGQREFDRAVIWVQLTSAAWVATGCALVARLWWRRVTEPGPRFVVVAAWLLAALLATVIAFLAPSADGISKALTLIVVDPVIWLACGVVIGVALIWRRSAFQQPVPLALFVWSWVFLAVALVAGTLLGGNGEVVLC